MVADQVGAEGLALVERAEPVGALLRVAALLAARQLAVPVGVGDLHRELVLDLALAILGEPLARDPPGLVGALAGDHAHPDADASAGRVGALALLLSTGLG